MAQVIKTWGILVDITILRRKVIITLHAVEAIRPVMDDRTSGGRELTVKCGHAYNRWMSEKNAKSEKLARDVELVSLISQNDTKAWEIFVESFTDWVLYKAKEWCVGHCPYSAGEYFCGLTSLSLQRQGKQPRSAMQECDEGLDTYIWIFEQLKRRVTKYSGKNDCLLSTFVWTILNSKEMHIDWLRWKYGRVF